MGSPSSRFAQKKLKTHGEHIIVPTSQKLSTSIQIHCTLQGPNMSKRLIRDSTGHGIADVVTLPPRPASSHPSLTWNRRQRQIPLGPKQCSPLMSHTWMVLDGTARTKSEFPAKDTWMVTGSLVTGDIRCLFFYQGLILRSLRIHPKVDLHGCELLGQFPLLAMVSKASSRCCCYDGIPRPVQGSMQAVYAIHG